MTTTQDQSHWDELANLPFPNGYPTEEARTRLLDEHYFQRAVQVYLGAEEAKGANLVEPLDLFDCFFTIIIGLPHQP